ncbi:hypothetical protein M0804_009194 [Polistes exclamans]|nr:hypothetical protein M0804_009194 [Polistes exclamans]
MKFGEEIYRFIVKKTKERQIGIKDGFIINDESDKENTLRVFNNENPFYEVEEEHSYTAIKDPEITFHEAEEIRAFNEIEEKNSDLEISFEAVEEKNVIYKIKQKFLYPEISFHKPEEKSAFNEIEEKDSDLEISYEAVEKKSAFDEIERENFDIEILFDAIREKKKSSDPEITFHEARESAFNEVEKENASHEVQEDNYFRNQKRKNYQLENKMDKNYSPIETIIEATKCARKHPDWSNKTLQPFECTKLRSSNQQRMWEKYINSGRAVYYKYSLIDLRTLDCLKEARKNNRPVSNL